MENNLVHGVKDNMGINDEIYDCMQHIAYGISQRDKDIVKSYYEQLNSLIKEYLGEEK